MLRVREAASMYFSLLAVFLVLLVVALQGTEPRENFPFKVPLDPQGLLELSWNISYHLEEVHFQIMAKEVKYGFLFGMSDRGGFQEADLAVLWSDGLQFYFAVGKQGSSSSAKLRPRGFLLVLGSLSVLMRNGFWVPRRVSKEDGALLLYLQG